MVSFSVITAFYKGNKYISDLINTIKKNEDELKRNKLESTVELIIINDSPDYDIELPVNLTVDVKVITHKKNEGIHQARITGLKNCNGDYIVFLDQDDLLEEDALFQEYMAIENNDMVVSNAYIERFDGTKKLLYKSKGQLKNSKKLNIYIKWHNQIVSPGHCLIRKDAIPYEWSKYVLKQNGSDDLFLWILLLSLKRKVITLDRPVYIHRYTGMNLSNEEEKMAESSLEIVEYMKKIDYITKKEIICFEKSRKQIIQLISNNYLVKILVILLNLNLYMPRIGWKIYEHIIK